MKSDARERRRRRRYADERVTDSERQRALKAIILRDKDVLIRDAKIRAAPAMKIARRARYERIALPDSAMLPPRYEGRQYEAMLARCATRRR